MTFGKCIVCGNDANGALIADTLMIRTIRAVKQRAGIAKNNTLVVCPNCIEAHAKRRAKFERKWATHIVMGVGLVLIIVVLPLVFGGVFSLTGLIFGPLIAIFIALLALFDYAPPLAAGVSAAAITNMKNESAIAKIEIDTAKNASKSASSRTAAPKQKHAQKSKKR